MKTIEQKAKAYDEALKKLRTMRDAWNNLETDYSPKDVVHDIEYYFPELKENENERIRKELLDMCKTLGKSEWIAWLEKQGNIQLPTFTFDNILALQCCMETVKKVQEDKELYSQLQSLHSRLHDAYWLEKQGEQKPHNIDNKFIRMRETKPKDISEFLDRLTTVEQEFLWEHIAKIRELDKEEQKSAWSEEDETKINYLIALLQNCTMNNDALRVMNEGIEDWLKSLKDRVQPRQEWSEDGEIKETIRCALLSCCNGSAINYKLPYDGYEKCLSWLKSLKLQSQWKPSEEQMDNK